MASTVNAERVLAPIAATNTAISGTSTAAVALGVQGFVTMSAIGVDVYILFGGSDVAAATTSNAFAIPSGGTLNFYVGTPGRTHFRAICAAGTGNLSWAYTG